MPATASTDTDYGIALASGPHYQHILTRKPVADPSEIIF